MLEHDRINVSERIDNNKPDSSCEYIIFHYWYFFHINFRFQPKVCNGCHDMTYKSMSFNSVAIVAIVENWYRIRLWFVIKSKGVDKRKNNDLNGKSGELWF